MNKVLKIKYFMGYLGFIRSHPTGEVSYASIFRCKMFQKMLKT